MPGLTTYPPFPENIPTHPLLVVDFRLPAGESWRAGRDRQALEGCDGIRALVVRIIWLLSFYFTFKILPSLKNHGVDEIGDMFEMDRETMALPLEDKIKYEQGMQGASFG